jgi:hypothetical protein
MEIEIDPEPGRLNRRCGKIGGIDEHFAGNASNVQAGSPEGSHLDDRDGQVVKSLVDDRVSRSGANNA